MERLWYTPRNAANLFITSELDTWLQDLKSDYTLKVCLC